MKDFNQDTLERPFLNCLTEIERTYIPLPKHIRIRVEKWIEKLIATGDNQIWKRHRNSYAKLLLSMVINKTFSDPFDSLPPEGPLAPFPSHLKTQVKNVVGPHESVFWRDIYNKFKNKSGNYEELSSKNQEIKREEYLNRSKNSKENKDDIISLNSISSSREVQNLNILVKEQAARIALLEQQLHDERTRHELELQRLQYSYRIELGKLNSEINLLKPKTYDPNRLAKASPINRENSPLRSNPRNDFSDSQHSQNVSLDFNRHSQNSLYTRNIANEPRILDMSKGKSTQGKEVFGNHWSENQFATSRRNHSPTKASNRYEISQNIFDITPKPNPTFDKPETYNQTINNDQNKTFNFDQRNNSTSFHSFLQIDPSINQPANGNVSDSLNGSIRINSSELEKFFDNIDRFQTEVKKMNESSLN